MVARVSGERLYEKVESIGLQGRVPVEGSLGVLDGREVGLVHYARDGKRLPFWVKPSAEGTEVTVEGDGVLRYVKSDLQPVRSYHPKDGDPLVSEFFLPKGTEATFHLADVTVTDVVQPRQLGRVDRFLVGPATALIRRFGGERPK